MKNIFSINSENPNYLAKIISTSAVSAHPNADRLAVTTVDGFNVIVGKDTKPGELFIYFPLESKINSDFLSFVNGFIQSEENHDQNKKGFFDYKNCRVRAQKFRGFLSEGYLHPINDFNEFLKEVGIKYYVTAADVGTEFDSLGADGTFRRQILFVEKYVNSVKAAGFARAAAQAAKNGKKIIVSRLVDNQFKFSPDYKNLKREINNVSPDDWIEILSKYHGANAVMGKLLVKRKLSFFEKICKKFGAKINELEYDLIYSSRRSLKSEIFSDGRQNNHFYDQNVWEIVAKRYENCIKNGITLYGELVGYTPSGAGIQKFGQKVFDYGCDVNQCEFYVFRITFTSSAGDIYEFSFPQLINYCQKFGLKFVPVYYVGPARNKYPELDTANHWHENFLEKLISEYLEKDNIFCKTVGLPDEGIVLSKRVGNFEGLKLKSLKFLEKESAEIDTGEENIEDEIPETEPPDLLKILNIFP